MSLAGAAPLAELADRSGLTEAMSEAMAECVISWHTHDPGVVPTHLGVAMADGRRIAKQIAMEMGSKVELGESSQATSSTSGRRWFESDLFGVAWVLAAVLRY